MRSRKLFSGTVGILVVLTGNAFAQGTRTVRGMVTNQHGQALAGAVVQIRNGDTLLVRSYVTQSDGEYHFAQLSTDVSYKVQAIYKGTYGRSKSISKFSSHVLVTLDLVIDLSGKHASTCGTVQPRCAVQRALLEHVADP